MEVPKCRSSIAFLKNISRALATLLKHLICSVQILNASKLREFVKNELVELHEELMRKAKSSATPTAGALIAYGVFHTLLMEVAYKDEVDKVQIWEIWKKMTKNEVKNLVLTFFDAIDAFLVGR